MHVRHYLERWKPAASARTHLLLAALLWTCVGTGLSIAGIRWSASSGFLWTLILLALGVSVGLAKGRYALEKTARVSAARMASRGDGKCLGGFLSWQSWLLVLGMMAAGYLLRRSGVPKPLLGFLYVAIGTALLRGSRVYWAERRRSR